MKAINSTFRKGFLAIFVAIVAVALMCFLTGCSSDSSDEATDESQEETSTEATTNETPEDLTITDCGYFTAGDEENIYWAVKVENNNANWQATTVELDIEGYDEDGNLVGTDKDNYINFIEPAGEAYVSGYSTIEGATDYEFTIVPRDDMWTEETDVTQSDWTKACYTDEVEVNKDSDEKATITGKVVNDTDYDMQYVDVYIVLNDADGNILGGIPATVTTLDAHSDADFSIEVTDPMPDYSTVFAYVSCNPEYMTEAK